MLCIASIEKISSKNNFIPNTVENTYYYERRKYEYY